MTKAATSPEPEDEEIRMGSEYSTARAYLARRPRLVPSPGAGKEPGVEPQHGSNDSDFGFAAQRDD